MVSWMANDMGRCVAMRRRRRRKRIAVARLLGVMMLILVFAGGIFILRGQNAGEISSASSDAERGGADAEENARKIKEVLADRTKYPAELLELLEKNPETIEFIEGYPKADKGVAGSLSEREKESGHPLFLQWDRRWGYMDYGQGILAASGCGPTCLSMAVVGLTHRAVTPYDVAKYSEESGFYVEGSGTAWLLMTVGARHYGLDSEVLGLDEAKMKSVLDAGGMIVCAMGAGDFTTEGHFILIYGYDGEGFLVNDPNSRVRSQKKWGFDTLSHQIRNLWGMR